MNLSNWRAGKYLSLIKLLGIWLLSLCCAQAYAAVLASGNVAFVSPSVNGGEYVNGITFTVKVTSTDVAQVNLEADGYFFGTLNAANNWSLRYNFTNVGLRNIVAKGINASGAVISQTPITITVVDVGIASPQWGSVYPNGAPIKTWASDRVKEVRIMADVWELGRSSTRDANNQFVITPVLFNTLGARNITANAYDVNGVKVDSRVVSVTVTNLAFLSPKEGAVSTSNSAITLQVAASTAIKRVDYYAETYSLGSSQSADTLFKLTQALVNTGSRQLIAKGYDASGNLVSTASTNVLVTATQPPPGSASNAWGVWLFNFADLHNVASNHSELAIKLRNMGVKRIYIKVADGNRSVLPSMTFPLNDPSVPAAYKAQGIEPWAWSYNYPTTRYSASSQGDVLYTAAKNGYAGYVVDAESEFESVSSSNLASVMQAFQSAKNQAIFDGVAANTFKLYFTTFGQIAIHGGVSLSAIDSYVDGYMPQTYTVYWGSAAEADQTGWINTISQQYRNAGATKPIHHITSIERHFDSSGGMHQMTVARLQTFLQNGGNEASIWALPESGDGTGEQDIPFSSWNLLTGINWNPGSVVTNPSGEGAINTTAYNWYKVNANYDAVYNNVVNGWFGTTTNACVAFNSTALRLSGALAVPDKTIDGNRVWTWTVAYSQYLLNEQGWKRYGATDVNLLRPGDIAFTISNGFGDGVPSHVYTFVGWQDQARGVAYVLDNQAKYPHRRNVTVVADPVDSWEQKDRMDFFVRSPAP